ncbi:MAG TPA: hypothetical protein VM597_11225 [Gemmataceae bacterium]|jgi:ribosomal protein S27AE|nr:hypothetical protein [Gemmataceae bacterium]
MLKVKCRHREFQVGTLKRRDSEELGLVVLDLMRQPNEASKGDILLYEFAENRISEFRAEVVLKLLGSPDQFARSDIERAINAYCQASGINPEAEWLDSQRQEAGLSFRVSGYAALRERYSECEIPYEELLSTSEWLERRALVLDRDKRQCVNCGSTGAANGSQLILQVHHRYYVRGWLPWDYPDDALTTLCLACHRELHEKESMPVYEVINGKLVRINWRPCIRCLGAGFFPQYTHVEGGVCFRCRGARFDMEIFDSGRHSP